MLYGQTGGWLSVWLRECWGQGAGFAHSKRNRRGQEQVYKTRRKRDTDDFFVLLG